jgi:Uma2 family endonuclease
MREEFERRYDAMPHVKKAELIEGRVYMPSPVSHLHHSRPQSDVVTFLGVYRSATPGVDGGDNATLRLDLDNEPQPDAFLRLQEAAGGRSRVDGNGYLEGAPELAAEVAASSVSYDLHDKMDAYRRNGVREYVVWRVLDGELDWFVLRGGVYERLLPDEAGLLKSEAFPGLWLDVAALLRGDMATVLARLQEGLNGEDHATFVRRLSETTS